MELFFLAILVLIMIAALASGYPVAFALPGSAIISIGLAAFFGAIFEGDSSAYFSVDGPIEWLTAGISNFRRNYWDGRNRRRSNGSFNELYGNGEPT